MSEKSDTPSLSLDEYVIRALMPIQWLLRFLGVVGFYVGALVAATRDGYKLGTRR